MKCELGKRGGPGEGESGPSAGQGGGRDDEAARQAGSERQQKSSDGPGGERRQGGQGEGPSGGRWDLGRGGAQSGPGGDRHGFGEAEDGWDEHGEHARLQDEGQDSGLGAILDHHRRGGGADRETQGAGDAVEESSLGLIAAGVEVDESGPAGA